MFPRRLFPGGGPQKAYSWPTPDAEGIILRPLTKLVTLIAATNTFRTQCGLATNDPVANEKLIDGSYATQKRIFYPEVDWESFDVFPSAVVQFGPDWHATWRAGGAQNYTRPGGSLRLILMDKDRQPNSAGLSDSANIGLSLRTFAIYVSQLLDDLRSQFAVDDELTGTGITQEDPPFFPPEETVKTEGLGWWTCSYLIEWSA